MSSLSKYSTSIVTIDGQTHIIYHTTSIVVFDSESIVLNSGGWQTATTKKKMNQAAWDYGLDYSVYQKDFDWYVEFNGDTYTFQDGMILQRN